MATKKTMGKRQRDRLKKAQAKREATAAAAAANPTYSQATSFNARPSSGPTTSRVQELDPGTYNNVEFLTNSMGMGDCVAESVTVDHKGRRLRVMMGTESVSPSIHPPHPPFQNHLLHLKQRPDACTDHGPPIPAPPQRKEVPEPPRPYHRAV